MNCSKSKELRSRFHCSLLQIKLLDFCITEDFNEPPILQSATTNFHYNSQNVELLKVLNANSY